MTWLACLYLLPAIILVLLAVFVAGAIGQRHHTEKDMSLLQDAEAFLDRIENAVAEKLKPLRDELAAVKTELADALGEKDALLARLAEFEQKVVAAFDPPQPQPETPAEQPQS